MNLAFTSQIPLQDLRDLFNQRPVDYSLRTPPKNVCTYVSGYMCENVWGSSIFLKNMIAMN